MTELRPDELSDWIAGSTLVVYGDKRPVPASLDARQMAKDAIELRRLWLERYWTGRRLDDLRASELRKLHWRDRFALWMAKHRRRWERASA